MDLKAYRPQIIELIPLHNSSDFNELLDKILFGESASDKFLIKMELNRLNQPCRRILDLRDKITESCALFEKDDLKHYLTKETIKVLEDNIKIYGLYTIGVFEAVHEYITEKKETQKKQQVLNQPKPMKKEQCEFFSLSQKNKRAAPRMFFVSDVIIITADGEKFEAQTSNISETGVKIKLKDDIHLNNNSLLTITFLGLALEYHDNILKEKITYRLIKQEIDSDSDSVSYFYLNCHNNKKFTAFIRNFIRFNQYKYKIDVHYYYKIAKIKALSHNYLAQMNSIPICLDENASSPFLFALENSGNKQLLENWYCNDIDQLPHLFNKLRLTKLIKQIEKQKTTTIYTFTHEVKGNTYFICASEEELLEKGLKKLFIQCGRGKANWHIYHLTLIPYQYQALSHDDITEPIPEVFGKITHMATLQKLTKAYSFNINQVLNTDDVNQLNQFIHRSENDNTAPSALMLFSSELRKEERYQYNSNLSISNGKNHNTGQIINFSYSGLNIKLHKINTFSISSIISVDLTDFQKISKKHHLSDLQYKIVATSPHNVLHLQVCDQKTLDTCQSFFSLLVKNNAKHFTCQPLIEKKQPLPKQLIEIAEESLLNAIFFISKEVTRPVISFAAIDVPAHPLHTLFSLNSDNNDELNYYPLANNQLYERLVIEPFKESITKEALIYIKAEKKDQHWEITSVLDEDFKSGIEKLFFIKESQLTGKFYALHYRFSILPKMNLQCIKSETRAISRYASHLTKKLEEELLSVEAMIEITDITTDISKLVKTF